MLTDIVSHKLLAAHSKIHNRETRMTTPIVVMLIERWFNESLLLLRPGVISPGTEISPAIFEIKINCNERIPLDWISISATRSIFITRYVLHYSRMNWRRLESSYASKKNPHLFTVSRSSPHPFNLINRKTLSLPGSIRTTFYQNRPAPLSFFVLACLMHSS